MGERSNLLADLARAKAVLQQRTVVAILTEGQPQSEPDQVQRDNDRAALAKMGADDSQSDSKVVE